MKKFFLLLAVMMVSGSVYAQDVANDTVVESKNYKRINGLAQFPGGEVSLLKYVESAIEYPEDCLKERIEGRVIIGFTVCVDCSIKDIKVKRGVHPSLDGEAIRVVESLPKFSNPSTDFNGTPYECDYTLPVNFKLPALSDSIEDVKPAARAFAEKEKVYEVVEQMPVFPGGDAELFKYLSQHIQYPADCIDECIQGRVIVNAVIKKDGTVGDVKVKRGKHPSLDAEAVRVIKALPKFKPGMMNGHAVNVYYLIPVNFKLP